MADPHQLSLIKKVLTSGKVDEWNHWRAAKHEIHPIYGYRSLVEIDLTNADLRGMWSFSHLDLADANFSGAKLEKCLFHSANLRRAKFDGANLDWTDLRRAVLDWSSFQEAKIRHAALTAATLHKSDLRKADFQHSDLSFTNLVGADLRGSDLSECVVYGTSAWDLKVDQETRQENLLITRTDEPAVRVDNIEVASFIYLLLNNNKIRDVISTIGNKGVLLLGRFSKGRKEVLEGLAAALRSRGFLPMIFDFERSKERDFLETIMVLAGLSLFVIADITNPKSAPMELNGTVPNYAVPFLPIIQEDEKPFSMFQNLQAKYSWVLDVVEYDSVTSLVDGLDALIEPAFAMHDKLVAQKAEGLKSKHIKELVKRSRSSR